MLLIIVAKERFKYISFGHKKGEKKEAKQKTFFLFLFPLFSKIAGHMAWNLPENMMPTMKYFVYTKGSREGSVGKVFLIVCAKSGPDSFDWDEKSLVSKSSVLSNLSSFDVLYVKFAWIKCDIMISYYPKECVALSFSKMTFYDYYLIRKLCFFSATI